MRFKSFSLLLLALMLLCMPPARAQLFIPRGDTQKPDLTPAQTVSMIYYRFSGQAPDFMRWAALTDEYKDAAEYEKNSVQERKANEVTQSFNLLATDEPIIVDFTASLSDYNLKNEGYLIENFTPDLFFPFAFAGENFAVVPKGAFDHQWLAASDMPAKLIDDQRRLSKSGREVTLTLTLAPRFADKSPPVSIKGTPYRLVSTEIRSMAIFDAQGALLWRQAPEQAAGPSPEQQKLMNLYK